MTSWGLPKLGLGWSEMEKGGSKTTMVSAPQQGIPSFTSKMQQETVVKTGSGQPPSRLGLGLGSSASSPVVTQSPGVSQTPKESLSTVDLLARSVVGVVDTRALDGAAKDDTERLLRWDAEAQQVDKEQSEVMQQQWRLFREQVATLSGEAIETKQILKELFRISDEETTERRAADEALQHALQSFEERILAMLEELRRTQIATMVQGLEMERAERISACNKLNDDLEAEKVARIGACDELATEISRLRNSLEDGLQKSAMFIKEQTSIVETRVRETEAGLQQIVTELQSALGEEAKCRIAGDAQQEKVVDEKFGQLRAVLEGFASKSDVGAIKNELERETMERIKGDKVLEETLMHLVSKIESDGATKTELQALKNELEHEMAERVKGDELCLDSMKQGLEALDNRFGQAEALTQTLNRDTRSLLEDEAKARAAGDADADDKLRQLLAEAASKADFNALRTELERMATDLEREAAARAEGDRDAIKSQIVETALKELASDFQKKLEQEMAARIAGDDKMGQLLTDGLEKAGRERSEIVRVMDSTEAKIMQMFRGMLEDEVKARTAGDQDLMKNLQDGLETAARRDSEIARTLESNEAKLLQTFKNELEREAQERALNDEKLMKELNLEIGRTMKESHEVVSRSLDVHVTGYSQDQNAHGARFNELKSVLETLTATMNDEFKALRRQLENEERARIEGDGVVEQRMMQSYSSHTEIHSTFSDTRLRFEDEIGKKFSELARAIELDRANQERLKAELDTARQEKQSGDAMLKQVLQDMENASTQRTKDLVGKLEVETGDRSKFEQELVERIRKIVDSIEFEGQERRTQIEKLQAGLNAVPNEVFTQQLKDIWDRLEKEVAERKAGDEALDAADRNGFEAVARKHGDQDAELKQCVELLKVAMWETAKEYKEELAKVSHTLHTRLQERDDVFTKGIQDLTDEVLGHKDHYAAVVKDHSDRHDDTTQRITQLVTYFEQEKGTRNEAHEKLRSAYETGILELERSLHEHKSASKDERTQITELIRQLHDKLESGLRDHASTLESGLQDHRRELQAGLQDHARVHDSLRDKLQSGLQDHARAVNDVHSKLQGQAKDQSSRHEDILRKTDDVERRRQTAEADFLRRMTEIEQQFEKKMEKSFKEHTINNEALDKKMMVELKRATDQLAAQGKDMKDLLNDHKDKSAALNREMNQKIHGHQNEQKDKLAAVVRDLDSKVQQVNTQSADKIEGMTRTLSLTIDESVQQERRAREKASGELLDRLHGHSAGMSELEKRLRDHTADLELSLRNDMQKSLDSHAQVHLDLKNKLHETQDKLHTRLNETHDRLSATHSDTRVRLESDLQNVLSDTHTKLQKELSELKRGVGEHELQDHLSNIVRQVDGLEATVEAESKMRYSMEADVKRQISELQENYRSLLSTTGLKAGAASPAYTPPTGSASVSSAAEISRLETKFREELVGMRSDMAKMLQEQVDKSATHERRVKELEQQIRGDLEKAAQQFGSVQESVKMDLERAAAEREKAASERVGKLIEERTKKRRSSVIVEESAKHLLTQKVEESKDLMKRATTDLGSQLEELSKALEEEQRMRRALAEQVHKNTAALEDAIHEGLAGHKSTFVEALQSVQKKFDADLALLHQEHNDKHSVHHNSHQKLKADLSAIESGMNNTSRSLNTIVTDLTKQVDAHVSSAEELKKDLKQHKERTDKDKQLLQKEFSTHKTRAEEERRARDAAHSNFQIELRNRDRTHKGLDGKMDDLEKRLKSALEALNTKHQTQAESMGASERRLRDEIAKLTQGATSRQSDMERKLREECNTVQTRLEKRISDLSVGLDGKQGSLREIVTKVGKDIEALSSSVQAQERQRTASEDKLHSKCDGLRAEFTQVAKEPVEALRTEFSHFSSKNKELEAAIQGASETLKKDVREHKAFVQSEIDSLRIRNSATDRATPSSPLASYKKTEDSSPSGAARERMQNDIQNDIELMNSRFRDQMTTLRNDVADVERRLRKEIKRNFDDALENQREQSKEMKMSIDRFNSDHNLQHKETRAMIIEQIRSVLQDADGKVQLSLDELRREVEDHRENLKTHLASQRGLDSETLLTAAVQRLEEDMERVHTLSGEITQLKLDQDLAQGNLERRLQDLDLLSGSFAQLQDDHDTLRRNVVTRDLGKQEPIGADGWEEEVRRLWEAIDTHTHDVSVEDFEEQEKATKNTMRKVVREVPLAQARVVQAPIHRLSVGSVPNMAARPLSVTNLSQTMPISPAMTTPIASPPEVGTRSSSISVPMPTISTIGVTPRGSMTVGSMASPVGSLQGSIQASVGLERRTSTLLGSQMVNAAKVLQQPLAVERMEQPPLLGSQVLTSPLGSQPLAVERVEQPPSPLMRGGSQRRISVESSATVGKAMHNIRPADTVSTTTTTEETTFQSGKRHHHLEAHAGKAVFEHVSDLDPETKHHH